MFLSLASIPEDVKTFLSYYHNFTDCLAAHDEQSLGADNSTTSVCRMCKENYQDLNKHFMHMSAVYSEGPCMDIVDMVSETLLQPWTILVFLGLG